MCKEVWIKWPMKLLCFSSFLVLVNAFRGSFLEVGSPCPQIFEYRYDNGVLYGVVQVNTPNDNVIQLDIELSVGNKVEGYNGNIELAYSKTQVIEDVLTRRPIMYKVFFPPWNNIPPKVTKIMVNGNLICSGPTISMNTVPVLTRINLQHILKLNVNPAVGDFSSGFHANAQNAREDDILDISPAYNEYDSPRPQRDNRNQVGQAARINFNPQPPGEASRVYPGNPFLNNLATSNPSRRGEEIYRVPIGQDGDILAIIRETPAERPPKRFPQGSNQAQTPPNKEFIPQTQEQDILDQTSISDNPFLNKWLLNTPKPNVDNRRDQTINKNAIDRQTTTSLPIIASRPRTERPPSSAIDFAAVTGIEDTPKVESNLIKTPYADVCGRSVVTNSLVVHGEPVARGAYPWLVAMFLLKNLGPEFRCSGSLVSHKHVVTAAHCLKNGTKTLRPEELLLVLGKLNLKNWSREIGLQIDAESLDIHPSYQPLSADADIAVITLSQTVQFTKFIKPICLWSDDSDLKDIVGVMGTVVGWGKDEYGDFMTEVPKKVQMPVVSHEECIRSKYSFKEITSERTFCAGFRNGSGPCNGDSGGGFMLQKNDRWTLRGIVSTSLLDQETRTCDLTNYVVFTDTSKFLDWLLSRIK